MRNMNVTEKLKEYNVTSLWADDQNQSCIMWNEFTRKRYGGIINRDIVSLAQLIINVAGVLGNAVVITLLRKHSLGGRLPTILFRSQAICDLLVNLESIFFGIDGELWSVPIFWVNHLICRLWHSQFLFWFAVQLSIGNLVLIGLERFLALSFPMTYQRLQPTRVAIYCLTGNFIYNLIMASPNILETGIDGDGCCISQHHVTSTSKLLSAYSIAWFLLIYLLALVLLLIFYGGVIVALRQSALLHRAQNRSAAMMRFTRMAIVITVVYVACISYDAFAYLIGRTGLWNYKYNTIWHNLGMLFVSVNSFANPYIYYLFVLRDSCRRKFKLYGFKLRPNTNVIQMSQQSHPSNYARSKPASLSSN